MSGKILFMLYVALLHFTLAQKEDDFKTKINTDLQICLKENNLNATDFNQKTILPKEKQIECFLNCLLVKQNCMKADGEFLPDGLNKVMDSMKLPEFIREQVQGCIKQGETGGEPCEKSYNFYKCIYELMQPKP